MNIITREFDNPLPGAHSKTIKFSFDEDSKDPVSQTLRSAHVWSADLAGLSSLFWKSDSNILDIGAHIGTYSCLAASFTTGKVFSIEPEPGNYKILEKNQKVNKFDNWKTFHLAASDKKEELAFCSNGPCSHVQSPGGTEAEIIIQADKLDDVLRDEIIDFIKIDVEGHEIAALDGLSQILLNQGPPILFEVNGFTLQWFNQTPNDLFKKVESYGYRIFVMNQKLVPVNSYEPFPFGLVDCLAIKDHHIPIINQFITLPLSEENRKKILEVSYANANSDMKGYFNWYRKIYKI